MPPHDRAWEPGLLVSDETWEPDLLEIIHNFSRVSTDIVDTPARGWYHQLAHQNMR